jgi:hypothetical protein
MVLQRRAIDGVGLAVCQRGTVTRANSLQKRSRTMALSDDGRRADRA